MVMHVLVPRRPHAPPVTDLLLSVAAHGALLVAVAGGHATASVPADGPTRPGTAAGVPGGEGLHWIGIGEGSGVAAVHRRPGVRPPIAYVVPGRGGLREHGGGARRAGGGGPRSLTRSPAGPAVGDVAPVTVADVRRPGPARVRRLLHLPIAALPRVTLPDAEPAELVAGVIASAPDLARRTARPDDFVPAPAAKTLADLLVRTGVTAVVGLRPDVHLHDLPIPLVSNPPPEYPVALAQAGVDGRVTVEFLIDSTGVVDLASLRVVQSTNVLFTEAVRSVLPQLRFMPAQLGEHAVGVLVRQPFVFTVRSRL